MTFVLDNSVAMRWYFGDGTSAVTPHPTHTYRRAGAYRAVCIVEDADGAITFQRLTVTVP